MLKTVRLSNLHNVRKLRGQVAELGFEPGSSGFIILARSHSAKVQYPLAQMHVGEFIRQKCRKGLLAATSNSSRLLPCSGSLGGICVYAEKKAAGKSSCSLVLTCARPPQLSTSSAAFGGLGDFIVQRQGTDSSENEISRCYELHALSSPLQKSFKKGAT